MPMQVTEQAVLEVENWQKESGKKLKTLFSEDTDVDSLSHFILGRGLQVSAGIINEIDSIEMKEGFIY